MTGDNTRMSVSNAGTEVGRAGAVLSVDLGAIADNYRLLGARTFPAQCAAVVKADAYGLGARQVVPALGRAGCRTFFVAHLDEALALQHCLPAGGRIHVLNGLPQGAERDAAAAGVVPVINSLGQLSAWRRCASATGNRLAATLQVDTGMSRLGLPPGEAIAIASDPALLEGIEPVLFMSHLACADEPGRPANEAQRKRFAGLRARFPSAPASLANSSGIFLGPAYHCELARPGAALYGINPTPGKPNPMRQVVRLSARLIQSREIAAGAGVGYGHDLVAAGPARLATISLGYADGWHRRYGAAAAFWNGHRLPIAGRISMDTTIVDISAIPRDCIEAGTLVDLICKQQDPDDLAAMAGTIGYEVLTSLGRRFHRRYAG